MRRILVAVPLFVLALAGAAPAGAHSSLKGTEPAAASQLAAPPERVLLRFTGAVEITPSAIKVTDALGASIPVGEAAHPGGEDSEVATDLPDLQLGSYLVTWRVTSGDSHPIQGAFTFRVGPAATGAATDAPAGVGAAAETSIGASTPPHAGMAPGQGAFGRQLDEATDDGSDVVKDLLTGTRFALFASLVLLVGGIAFVVMAWPAGAGSRRVVGLLRAAWAVAASSTVAGVALQGAYAAALPVSAAVRPAVVADVLDTRFGQMSMLRLGLLVLVWPVWLLLRASLTGSTPRLTGRVAVPAVVLGAGILLTLGLSGHAASGDLRAVAAVSDLLHLSGVSAWIGGLTVLVACALPRRDADELSTVVPRFSTLAFVSVLVIVATGTFQSWRQVGSLDELASTSYGRLLMVKLALFTGLVGLGGLSRAWVRRRYRGASAMSPSLGAVLAEAPAAKVARLRRSVGAEVVVAFAVLGVTAFLVNTPPARSAGAETFSTTVEAEGLRIDVDVDPAKVGSTDIHVHTRTPEGETTEVEKVDALLGLDAQQIGPIEVPMHRVGPGRFMAHGFNVPVAGTWKIEVIVLRSQLDQVRAVAAMPVG